jgi:hypothetical protein
VKGGRLPPLEGGWHRLLTLSTATEGSGSGAQGTASTQRFCDSSFSTALLVPHAAGFRRAPAQIKKLERASEGWRKEETRGLTPWKTGSRLAGFSSMAPTYGGAYLHVILTWQPFSEISWSVEKPPICRGARSASRRRETREKHAWALDSWRK